MGRSKALVGTVHPKCGVPEVGPGDLAAVFVTEIGDISRFPRLPPPCVTRQLDGTTFRPLRQLDGTTCRGSTGVGVADAQLTTVASVDPKRWCVCHSGRVPVFEVREVLRLWLQHRPTGRPRPLLARVGEDSTTRWQPACLRAARPIRFGDRLGRGCRCQRVLAHETWPRGAG